MYSQRGGGGGTWEEMIVISLKDVDVVQGLLPLDSGMFICGESVVSFVKLDS